MRRIRRGLERARRSAVLVARRKFGRITQKVAKKILTTRDIVADLWTNFPLKIRKMGPNVEKSFVSFIFFSCQKMVKFYLVVTDVFSDIALKSYSQYKVNDTKKCFINGGGAEKQNILFSPAEFSGNATRHRASGIFERDLNGLASTTWFIRYDRQQICLAFANRQSSYSGITKYILAD
jgi:hypothetical protein